MKNVARIAWCLLWSMCTLLGVSVLAMIVINPKGALYYHGSFYNRGGPSGTFYVATTAVVMIFVGVIKLRRLLKRNR